MKLTINPKYARLRGFTESLPRIFPTSTGGKTLYEGRNIVKLYTQNGQRITVKSYGHLTLFNRLIYGSLRKSKAERAFRHAIRLQCLGIDTPEAIASLEIRRFGMLRDSYFVSAYTDYLPVSDITASFPQNPDSQNMLDQLVGFLVELHRTGVYHRDLHIGNILYRCDTRGNCRFQLIDTNRMTFHRRLSQRRRIENLRRLACETDAYLYILKRYAEATGADTHSFQLREVLLRLFLEAWHHLRHKIKMAFRAIRPGGRTDSAIAEI